MQYRLKQIDFDGKFEYSEIITVEAGNYASIPKEFSLEQNYPNPFNPATTIKFSIPTVETSLQLHVTLKVYDVIGSEVATLVNEPLSAGNYEVNFNAGSLTSGVYFYRLKTSNGIVMTKKLMLLK